MAGFETTVNLIGNGTLALVQHPDQLTKLRGDPALITSAVEELLRYANPVGTTTDRYAREELTIADEVIPRGALVILVLASANRDERQFANPDVFDITRAPNRHLAFGWGVHYCVGAPHKYPHSDRLQRKSCIRGICYTLGRASGGSRLAETGWAKPSPHPQHGMF